MKTNISNHSQRGFAVVVVLVILSILGILVAANARRLHALDRELKRVEQQQIKRLNPTAPAPLTPTNTPPSL